MTTGDERPTVATLFSSALKQPDGVRAQWLAAQGADEATRREVQALLAVYDEDPGFLEAPIDAADAMQALEAREARANEGRRLGPYRLVGEIGRGGMGVVYEARRDDAAFERRVAVKLLPAAWAHSRLAQRFDAERRILAALDHPSIARLLDAGSSDEGIPYLVMDYVDGQPIDAWCRTRHLTLHRRVGLVVAVCGGVAHAHQQLVVHRDLKPANILVNEHGQPKLLDFGIATLISAEGTSAGLTVIGQHSFTPEYASPEQARGHRVTTASDVYSLGVVTYLLLAGRLPYSLTGLPPLEVLRTICDLDPPPPSSVAPMSDAALLRGDLDAIVLKALRKDAGERYRSVFALEEDLQAWLDKRPVAARPATRRYRAMKFVGRHRAGVAAAAVALVAIIAGGVATAWQARIAALQRDRAENRFRDVQRFSRSLLFEVHESLRGLPGATEPRRLLLERAVQLLDSLAADADNDDVLKLEVAEGYRRLGHVQGSAVSANLGDGAGATASFEKAARLGDNVLAHQPASLAALNVATGAYDDLSSALLALGRSAEADRAYERHLALITPLEQQAAASPEARASLASSLLNLGVYRANRRDLAGARPFYERAVAAFESLPPERRALDSNTSGHSFALKRLGSVLLLAGDLEGGERRYRAALALDEQLVARHPGNARYQYDLTFALSDLAFAANSRGDVAAATALWTRVLGIREAALAADPKDQRTMQGVARTHSDLMLAARAQGQAGAEVAHGREVVRIRTTVAATSPTAQTRLALAGAQVDLAMGLLNQADKGRPGQRPPLHAEAETLLTAAAATASALATSDNPAAPEVLAAVATERARLRR